MERASSTTTDRFDPSSTGQKGTPATSLARVQFFSVSLDGFGTGEGLSHDAPFGHAGDRLHEWMFVTRWWHEMVGERGGGRPGAGARGAGAVRRRRSTRRYSFSPTTPDRRSR